MVTVIRPDALVLVATTLLSACTSHRAHELERDADPQGEQEPPAVQLATPPAQPNLAAPVAWRWIHRGGAGGWSADIGPTRIRTGERECSFEHDDDAHTLGQVCCDGPKRWCVDMREDFVPGIALASDGRRLFVADYPAISSGARFAAYALDSGAMLWSRDALAIGPQAHSEYFNVVQLRLVNGQLIAYGDEAHGAYVETMDPATGASLHHTTLERPEVGWSWPDPAPEPELTVALPLADGRECRLDAPEQGPTTLSCAPAGAPAWGQVIEGDFVGRGALIGDEQRVVAVTWSRIATGARARAWALADGSLLWDRAIEGLGPQDHSKYSNLVQLGLEGELVIVRGLESHGHYVEALDVATGALRWSVSWPDF